MPIPEKDINNKQLEFVHPSFFPRSIHPFPYFPKFSRWILHGFDGSQKPQVTHFRTLFMACSTSVICSLARFSIVWNAPAEWRNDVAKKSSNGKLSIYNYQSLVTYTDICTSIYKYNVCIYRDGNSSCPISADDLFVYIIYTHISYVLCRIMIIWWYKHLKQQCFWDNDRE